MTSGLRRGEALELGVAHVDFALRSIIIHKNTKTKRTGISFQNEEVEALMKGYWNGTKPNPETKFFHNSEVAFRKQLHKAWKKAGAKVAPQMLRVWFSNKMGEPSVQDRYIDTFCERTQKAS